MRDTNGSSNYFTRFFLVVFVTVTFILSCEETANEASDGITEQPGDEYVEHPEGWSEETHGKTTEPNYDLLFDLQRVHTLSIVISSENFAEMEANLEEIAGSGFMPGGNGFAPPGFAEGSDPSAGPPDGMFPEGFDPFSMMNDAMEACTGLSVGDKCQFNDISGTCNDIMGNISCVPENLADFLPEGVEIPEGMPAPGDFGGEIGSMFSEDPRYIPVDVTYDNHTWRHVGMRYKGNSSLMTAVGSGNGKRPFRLNFNRYEDDYPEIKGQRFYGFRELTFSSNWTDNSQIRETLATEIFRDRGIAAARCAFYRVFVDAGEGDVYWGLYTMIEDPDDGAILDAQFGGRGGNLYKPEGTGASWTSFSSEGFVKKNHIEEADYSDVIAAIDALHASKEDAISWRTELERFFDVDLFLNWLAVNTTIQNWDSYGRMAHNYYLYGDPAEDGRLNWIPWDHNMSMSASMMGRGFPMAGGSGSTDDASAVLHTDVSDRWPLISILLSDEQYNARYREYLARSLEGAFALDRVRGLMHRLHEMITPYAVGPEGETTGHTTITSADAFLGAIDGENGLMEHIKKRHEIVRKALATP